MESKYNYGILEHIGNIKTMLEEYCKILFTNNVQKGSLYLLILSFIMYKDLCCLIFTIANAF
jgi:hypothetical protein